MYRGVARIVRVVVAAALVASLAPHAMAGDEESFDEEPAFPDGFWVFTYSACCNTAGTITGTDFDVAGDLSSSGMGDMLIEDGAVAEGSHNGGGGGTGAGSSAELGATATGELSWSVEGPVGGSALEPVLMGDELLTGVVTVSLDGQPPRDIPIHESAPYSAPLEPRTVTCNAVTGEWGRPQRETAEAYGLNAEAGAFYATRAAGPDAAAGVRSVSEELREVGAETAAVVARFRASRTLGPVLPDLLALLDRAETLAARIRAVDACARTSRAGGAFAHALAEHVRQLIGAAMERAGSLELLDLFALARAGYRTGAFDGRGGSGLERSVMEAAQGELDRAIDDGDVPDLITIALHASTLGWSDMAAAARGAL